MVPGLRKVRRPRMTNHRGRTWDTCYVKMPDGADGRGWLDTTWGTRFYVEHNGQWYAGQIAEFETTSGAHGILRCDLRHRQTA